MKKPMVQAVDKLQRGFSLITAIFLLVVLASLGAVMVTFFTAQQQSSALDVLGSRAYQAARAGMEWSVFQIAQSGVDGGAFVTACRGGAPVPQLALPAGVQLSPFSVNVACSATSHVEGANTLWVYSVTSTATGVNGALPGQPDYIARVISVTIGR